MLSPAQSKKLRAHPRTDKTQIIGLLRPVLGQWPYLLPVVFSALRFHNPQGFD